jgi:Actin
MSLVGEYIQFKLSTSHHSQSPFHFLRDVTDHLQLLLRKSGHHLHTTAEREVVRTIKEKCCYVALSPSKEEKESVGRMEEFRLPDGNAVQVIHVQCLFHGR